MPKTAETTQEEQVKMFEQKINFMAKSKEHETGIINRLDNQRKMIRQLKVITNINPKNSKSNLSLFDNEADQESKKISA